MSDEDERGGRRRTATDRRMREGSDHAGFVKDGLVAAAWLAEWSRKHPPGTAPDAGGAMTKCPKTGLVSSQHQIDADVRKLMLIVSANEKLIQDLVGGVARIEEHLEEGVNLSTKRGKS